MSARESLQAELLARIEAAPAAPCLGFRVASQPVQWLTREELYRAAESVAVLLAENGLRRGRVCVIVLSSGQTAALVVVATLLLGAIPVLVAPPQLLDTDLERLDIVRSTVRRTNAALVVCPPALRSEHERLTQGLGGTRVLFGAATTSGSHHDRLSPAMPRTGDVVAMQLTSGTTARPRICVWDQAGMLAALDGMTSAMGLTGDDRCVNWTPLYHDMGLVNNFFLCLVRGVPLMMLSPRDFARQPAIWLQTLFEARATVTWSPNFGFALSVRKVDERDLIGVRLDGVRSFWNAAERIHLETLEAFHRRFGPFGVRRDALKTNYGCAENIGGATFSRLDGPPCVEHVATDTLDRDGTAELVDGRASGASVTTFVGVGRSNPKVTVRILSPAGRLLPDGRIGEICLATASQMVGYHRDARRTRRALREGVLHTGDLGYLRNDELYWVGRLRERITVQGRKIDPSAFEATLASTAGVREGCFVAFGVPSVDRGTDRVVVVSEIRDSAAGLASLHAAIRRNCLVQFGITPEVLLVPAGTLPKTSSGKRRHRHFRKLYLSGELAHIARTVAAQRDAHDPVER